MTKLSQTILLKRWSLYLREFLDVDMVEDIKKEYGDELGEACAKIINVIDVCEKEEGLELSPEMAAGVLLAIIAECASVGDSFPDYTDLLDLGYLLSRDTGYPIRD